VSPEAPKAKSFADILQQNQEFIAHLQTLQDDIASQLALKETELAAAQQQLDAKQRDLDDFQNAQLQWAMDRQALLDQQAAVQKGQKELQDRHQRAEGTRVPKPSCRRRRDSGRPNGSRSTNSMPR